MSLRIVLLATGLALGGAERVVVDLAVALRRRGHDPAIVTLRETNDFAGELAEAGVPVASLRMPKGLPDPRGILRLRNLVAERRPDILHAHMVHANLLARTMRPFFRDLRIVSTAHSSHEGGAARELLYRATDPLSDVTVHCFKRGAERYVEDGLVAPHRIRVVPNGIDTDTFSPDQAVRERVRAELGANGRFLWVTVARLAPEKDHATLLRAIARLGRVEPPPLFAFAGGGPLAGELRSRAEALGLGDAVRFLGPRRDVADLLRAADAFVLSSTREGLSLVTLEAAATALPVVATAVGGLPESLGDLDGSVLVRPGDPAGLGDAMEATMRRPAEERREAGARLRARVLERYGAERAVEAWEALYADLLGRP